MAIVQGALRTDVAAVAVAVLLALLLAACGGGSGGDPGSTDQINGIAVPPAPEPAVNASTLAGIDSDRDGVRDDVDRWLATTFGASSSRHQVALDYAKVQQVAITAPTAANIDASIARLRCVTDPRVLSDLGQVTRTTLDTVARRRAYANAFAGVSVSADACAAGTRTAKPLAATTATAVLFVNGIQKTVDEAQESRDLIQRILDESANHTDASQRRSFVVELIWNPIGWFGEDRGPDFWEDNTELFLQKTAEEHYADHLSKLRYPAGTTVTTDIDAAAKVAYYLDHMAPGGNEIEDRFGTETVDLIMEASQRTARKIVSRTEELGAAVVVAHSQGNLLANLAWARLAEHHPADVSRRMRIVNIANTTQIAIHDLDLTHDGDRALSPALEVLAIANLLGRTTPACSSDSLCTFTLAEPTFTGLSAIGGDGHGLDTVYLSNLPVQELTPPVISFTAGAIRFRDRFEDLVYAATGSLELAASALVPGIPTATPPSGSFEQDTSIAVSSSNAERIYCSIRTSIDGSSPADPPEPTDLSNDACGQASPYIAGASGNFQLLAPASGTKRLKVRFRAYGNGLTSPPSPTYEYTVVAPSPLPPGLPVASPATGSFVGNHNIGVTAFNAQRIYCTLRTTSDGSLPTDPPEPTDTVNDPCGLSATNYIQGASGSFVLVAPPSGSKNVKVRFRAWNNGLYGPGTTAYPYQVSAAAPTAPGVPSASPPSGSFPTGANISVAASNAQRIYCTIRSTLDGSLPADPPEPTDTLYDPCGSGLPPNHIEGASGTFLLTAPPSGIKRLKVRFRAWSGGVLGTTSASHEYQSGAVTVVTPNVPALLATDESYVGTTDLPVVANNAQRIYCSITASSDGSTPAYPPEPSDTVNDPCNPGPMRYATGPSGSFVLLAPDTGFKRVRVRLRAWNSGQYSDTSTPAELVVRSIPVVGSATLAAMGDLAGGGVYSKALGVSGDGLVAVGVGLGPDGSEAARWPVGGSILGIGELPGGLFDATAYAASFTGDTIVGLSRSARSGQNVEAFRWTALGGMQGLGGLTDNWAQSMALAVSGDGATVVGESLADSVSVPFRWTLAGGMQDLGAVAGPCPGCTGSARGVSDDGNTVVGASGGLAFRWTASGGMQALPPLTTGGPVLPGAWASGMSPDGRFIVGASYGAESPIRNPAAVMWRDGEIRALGQVDWSTHSDAKSVSSDGSVVVGSALVANEWVAFVWTPGRGVRTVDEMLRREFGIDTTGWRFTEATGVSRDGRTIVGAGWNPLGQLDGWRAGLSTPPP